MEALPVESFSNHKSQSEKLRIQRRSRDEKETLSLVDAWGHSFHQIACIIFFSKSCNQIEYH